MDKISNISAAFIQLILDRSCKYLDLSNSRILDLKSTQNIFINCIQSTELNLEYTNVAMKKSLFSIQEFSLPHEGMSESPGARGAQRSRASGWSERCE